MTFNYTTLSLLRIEPVIQRDPALIDATASLKEAITVMRGLDSRPLIVVSPFGKVIGVLSKRDVFRHLQHTPSADAPVKDAMTTPVIWGDPEMNVGDAAQLILRHRITCLPIVDLAREPVGTVTLSDLLTLST